MDKNSLLSYGGSNIYVAKNSEKHRLNVSQYLGADDMVGIENQLFEILDNSVDECIEYHSKLTTLLHSMNIQEKIPPRVVTLTITSQDTVVITDEGRGLPCNYQVDEGQPAIYAIYENDSAGGKGNLNQGGYTTGTSGMHGAGAAVSKSCTSIFDIVTATQGEYIQSENRWDGRGQYHLRYDTGERTSEGLSLINSELELSNVPILAQIGVYQTGTQITYHYDPQVLHKTYNGTPYESAYMKDSILSRASNMLIGISNPDAVVIKFKYHEDDEIILTPHEFTPYKFLGVKSESDYIVIDLQSTKDKDEEGWYSGKLYLYREPIRTTSRFSVIVNRLTLKNSAFTDVLDECLLHVYQDLVTSAVGGKLPPRCGIPRQLRDNHTALFVMQMSHPKFSGQTKRDLSNRDFVVELRNELSGIFYSLEDTYLKPYIQQGANEVRELLRSQELLKKDREKAEQRKKQLEKQNKVVQDAIASASDPLANLKHQLEGTNDMGNSRFLFKDSPELPQDCYLVLVEGPSAANALGEIQNLGIKVGGLGGKPANIFKESSMDYEQLKGIICELYKPYKGIYIITDADPDALHIRILIIATIMKFAPHYINDKKTFIIKSPNAKLYNSTTQDITVDVHGVKYTYPASQEYYSVSPNETAKAVKAGMTVLTKYAGLADTLTDSQGINALTQLIEDPKYRELISPPNQQEIAMLSDILSDNSILKKEYSNNICTPRNMYIRNASGLGKTVKLRLNLRTQKYNLQPKVCNYKLYEPMFHNN